MVPTAEFCGANRSETCAANIDIMAYKNGGMVYDLHVKVTAPLISVVDLEV